MNCTLGRQLSIRSRVYVAGKPVPFFWPMRSFIHHNPLHGLEGLPFPEAAKIGSELFHGKSFLSRRQYQKYLKAGKIRQADLHTQVNAFCASHPAIANIDLSRWAETLLCQFKEPLFPEKRLVTAEQIYARLHQQTDHQDELGNSDFLPSYLRGELLGDRPVYDALDALYDSDIGARLNEQVVRACLDFFDEGQSVWVMPNRSKGFFAAWRDVAPWRVRRLLAKIEATQQGHSKLTPEQVIDYVMKALEVPEELWTKTFTRELAALHGWAGFIRWRSQAKHYYWAENFPGDLVDLLAIRLTLAMVFLNERRYKRLPKTQQALKALIENHPHETYLRLELNSGEILPSQVRVVEDVLARGRSAQIERVCTTYIAEKRAKQADLITERLKALAKQCEAEKALDDLSKEEFARLLDILITLEAQEGMIWLRAMEAKALNDLVKQVNVEPPSPRVKRPFVQAAFCIDTRSERIRRHLESVGDYQTFGIAGFFGVPVSLIELGKGSEAHLCPVLLTPKNLVLEISASVWSDEAVFSTLGHATHELKENIFTPFVTVEAIGLLFGFDMIGKTIAPRLYNRWRKRLYPNKPHTHLLIDKLSREQADSIIRAVQRAVIAEALESELGLSTEQITDDIVRALREVALGHVDLVPELVKQLRLSEERVDDLVNRLRKTYRINPSFARQQLEQLGRIGFSLEEQVGFVSQALSSIGLTENFSRFVLLVGHGSTSENNPYESALDCGACGGAHGLVNARVLAQMANKPAVRQRLLQQGIKIPNDTWFMPALHNTTTDEITLHDLELLPPTHLIYLDRLRTGLVSAARLCAQERLPSLQIHPSKHDPLAAFKAAERNSMDWSQVRPEWGLARNAYFIIGRRALTRHLALDGRAFLHSYDYRVDRKNRLLENILTGPLVVGQWINMEHYFSAVDNERFGSGSKIYHNVTGRFGVMTGNLSDLRTGLPAQTVLDRGFPYHQPLRLMTVIEAPFAAALEAISQVSAVKQLVNNGWIRLVIIDPQTAWIHIYNEVEWETYQASQSLREEMVTS